MFDDLEELSYTNSIPNTKVKGQTKAEKEGKTMSAQVVEGTANFSHVKSHDSYMGQSTGKFSITITLDEDDASALAAKGVKIKEYQGAKQRKFSSKFDVITVDADGNPYNREIPYNSKVRIKYRLGQEHPVHGVSVYLEAVKVLEEAEMSEEAGAF